MFIGRELVILLSGVVSLVVTETVHGVVVFSRHGDRE